jgi:hypothetical protein
MVVSTDLLASRDLSRQSCNFLHQSSAPSLRASMGVFNTGSFSGMRDVGPWDPRSLSHFGHLTIEIFVLETERAFANPAA